MPAPRNFKVLVCRGPECGEKRHSSLVHAAFADALKTCSLGGNQAVLDTYSCFGKCKKGINVLIRESMPGENAYLVAMMPTVGPHAFLYNAVKPEEARKIVEEHIAAGRPLVEWTRRV